MLPLHLVVLFLPVVSGNRTLFPVCTVQSFTDKPETTYSTADEAGLEPALPAFQTGTLPAELSVLRGNRMIRTSAGWLTATCSAIELCFRGIGGQARTGNLVIPDHGFFRLKYSYV